MSEFNFVELFLTCGSWQEAQTIADSLLEQRLVACVEFMEIKSKYHWKGGLETADEIKLIMKTIAANFKKVETAVAKLHGYDSFVLEQIPLTNLSADAKAWWKAEMTKQVNKNKASWHTGEA